MSLSVETDAGTVVIADDGSVTITGATPSYIGTAPVFAPPRNPDIEPEHQFVPNVATIRFGDGYSQRQPRGVNHIDGRLALVWTDIPAEHAESIIDFLRAREGTQPFWYGLPGQPLLLWTCPRWGKRMTVYPRFTVAAELERCFDPVAD